MRRFSAVAGPAVGRTAFFRVPPGGKARRPLRLLPWECLPALLLLLLLPSMAVLSQDNPSPAPAKPTETAKPTEPAKPLATPIQIPNLPLGVVILPNGKALNLTVGIGSAAFRSPIDAPGRIWLLTDRGPSIDCPDSRRIVGAESEQLCGGEKNGRYFLLPGFAPSIYGVDIGLDNVARINVYLPLKGRSGRPISGRPPLLAPGKAEPAFAADARPLAPDPSGVDPEGLVRMRDGSFWVAEEYGPSLLHVQPDGTIDKRLVPQGSASNFKDADYEVIASLPAILRQRGPNRGFEGLALAADERSLFVAMQSPLANPDGNAMRQSRHVRLFQIALPGGETMGEYLYDLSETGQFGADNDGRERLPYHVQISEIVTIGPDRLLVLERVEKTARLYVIELSESALIPAIFDNIDWSPGLESLSSDALLARGVAPLKKTLILDTDQIFGLPAKIEGIALLDSSEMLLINDNDFGIDGVRTQLFKINLPEPVLR